MPLAAKLSLSTVLVLALASVVVIQELTTREQAHLVDAKRAAAERTAELFVAYDSVSLAFGDAQGVRDDLSTLGATPEVTYAAVWDAHAAAPLADVGKSSSAVERPAAKAAVETTSQHVSVVRPIVSPEGDTLGVALVRMSLARENAAFAQARWNIIGFTALLAAVIAVLITLIVRFTVVRPLGVLARAAVRLQHGERVKVGLRANDEVGLLSTAFDTMTEAIVDREMQLLATTEKLQGVLDHIGQAIVIFGRDSHIEPERSSQAITLVGDKTACPSVVQLLFPEGESSSVEREAFDAWMGLVFDAPLADWDELSDLAPDEAVIARGGNTLVYRLVFKPLVEAGKVSRVMLLATDITDERALLQRVAKQGEEHARSIAMMRRLVAGGGQVFVRFLESARYRVRTSLGLVRRIEKAGDRGEHAAREEFFRHIHTLRGEVRCFDLDVVESELAAIEFGLADLRARNDEGYDLKVACAEFTQRLTRVAEGLDAAEALFVEQSPVGDAILDQVTVRRSVVDQLVSLGNGASPQIRSLTERLSARPFGEIVFFVVEAVPHWLGREHKEAQLVIEGRTVPVPGGLARVLAGALPHLLRNAIAHGVESAAEREDQGKPGRATITLVCARGPRGVYIDVADDGAGFDQEALLAKASSLGLKASDDALELAYSQGVSTRQAATDTAGHGVGLGAVREEIQAVGYTMSIESRRGQGTRIRLEPTEHSAQASV